MRSLAIVVLAVAAACVGGCTTVGSTPATAPVTTAPPSTTSTTSPDVEPTTTTESATTTLDRIAEVTAIFTDLEQRRLEAIYTGDVDAFTALFADTPYLDRSLEVFDVIEPGPVPEITLEVLEVLRDDECLALFYESRAADGERLRQSTAVLSESPNGYRYVFLNDGKGGWMCDGPHPLSS